MLSILLGQLPHQLERCTLTHLGYLWTHAHARAEQATQ